MAEKFLLNFHPPGPVANAFLLSRARVQCIMGPIGSAKTSTAMVKFLLMATKWQPPSPIDGVRYSKFAVVRDTYPNLEATTIPTWHRWLPRDAGAWSGDSPPSHNLRFRHGGGLVDVRVEFIALGEKRVQDVMRGWEGTGALLNEADLLDPEVLTYVNSRVGRYPAMSHGGPGWTGVLLDCNAPDVDNYVYRNFVEDVPENWALFRQPSGLSPQAENLENLPPGYYQEQMKGAPEWFVRRMIRNEFGFSRSGQPVFSEFNDALHVAGQPLAFVPAWPLRIGADAGRTPAAVFLQQSPAGQWRVIDELVATGMGAETFARALNQHIADRFRGAVITGYGDPASANPGDQDERSWLQIVEEETRLPWYPAPGGNNLTLRLETVRRPLTRMFDGRDPAILLSPRCKVLRRAFNSGYRFRRVQLAGVERYEDKPEKNEWSHPMDALQNALLGSDAHYDVLNRRRPSDRARRQAYALEDDPPRDGLASQRGGPMAVE